MAIFFLHPLTAEMSTTLEIRKHYEAIAALSGIV
jgi:hypothetical protein